MSDLKKMRICAIINIVCLLIAVSSILVMLLTGDGSFTTKPIILFGFFLVFSFGLGWTINHLINIVLLETDVKMVQFVKEVTKILTENNN